MKYKGKMDEEKKKSIERMMDKIINEEVKGDTDYQVKSRVCNALARLKRRLIGDIDNLIDDYICIILGTKWPDVKK